MDPSSLQRDLLSQLQSAHERFSSDWDGTRGVLSFARADNLTPQAPRGAVENQTTREARLRQFLETHGPLFGPPNLMRSVRLLKARTDDIGFVHHQYQQVVTRGAGENARRSIEVYSSKLAAHFAPGGELVEVQSSCYQNVEPRNQIKVTAASLRRRALDAVRRNEAFKALQDGIGRREKLFPLMQTPRLVIYPWKGDLIYAWATYGYGVLPREEQDPRHATRETLAFGQMFFDAESGDLFLFAPTRKGAETQTVGSGLGSTPIGGPFASETLRVVQVDAGSTYLLKNKTQARNIITYDANANSSWVYPSIPSFIESGASAASSDTEGDHNWNRTAPSTSDADRTSSQQPEVDEHATCADLCDWYAAIGGRVGWDDDHIRASGARSEHQRGGPRTTTLLARRDPLTRSSTRSW